MNKTKIKIIAAAFSIWAITTLAVLSVVRMPVTHAQALSGYPSWFCGLDGVGNTLTLCKTAPEPGMKLYITDIVAQSTTGTAGQFILRHGTAVSVGGAAACASDTVTIFPAVAGATTARYCYPGNSAHPCRLQFNTPLEVPAGRDLCALGIATQLLVTTISGKVGP